MHTFNCKGSSWKQKQHLKKGELIIEQQEEYFACHSPQVLNLEFGVCRSVRSEISFKKHLSLLREAFPEFQVTLEAVGLGPVATYSSWMAEFGRFNWLTRSPLILFQVFQALHLGTRMSLSSVPCSVLSFSPLERDPPSPDCWIYQEHAKQWSPVPATHWELLGGFSAAAQGTSPGESGLSILGTQPELLDWLLEASQVILIRQPSLRATAICILRLSGGVQLGFYFLMSLSIEERETSGNLFHGMT